VIRYVINLLSNSLRHTDTLKSRMPVLYIFHHLKQSDYCITCCNIEKLHVKTEKCLYKFLDLYLGQRSCKSRLLNQLLLQRF